MTHSFSLNPCADIDLYQHIKAVYACRDGISKDLVRIRSRIQTLTDARDEAAEHLRRCKMELTAIRRDILVRVLEDFDDDRVFEEPLPEYSHSNVKKPNI